LPARIEGLSLERAIDAMRGDKKSEAGAIRLILLEDIGRAVQRTVPEAVLRATLAAGGYA
jgi:3-dehydroquinate synthase